MGETTQTGYTGPRGAGQGARTEARAGGAPRYAGGKKPLSPSNTVRSARTWVTNRR